VKNTTRPAIFKWRQTAPELIVCAVRWYLRYSLSLRDVEELFAERGVEADHTTIWRWVQRYGPELQQRLRRHLKPTNKSWRVDETYIRVQGRWCYLGFPASCFQQPAQRRPVLRKHDFAERHESASIRPTGSEAPFLVERVFILEAAPNRTIGRRSLHY
jgi:hypothetical protein